MSSPWIQHVKNFRSMHPGMSYAEALKAASPSYHGVSGGKFSVNKAVKKVRGVARKAKNSVEKAQHIAEQNQHLLAMADKQFNTNLSDGVRKGLNQASRISNQVDSELNGGKFKLGRAIRKSKNTVQRVGKVSKKVLNNVEKYGLPALEMAGVAVAPELVGALETARMVADQTGGSFKTHGGRVTGGCSKCYTCGGSMVSHNNSSMINHLHPSFNPKKPKSFARSQVEN